jgi:hypothetical protein
MEEKKIPSRKRSELVGVRLTKGGLEKLDLMRGEQSRGEFIRGLLAAEWSVRAPRQGS